MDDNNDMEYALNGDFDSELFDCWDSAAEQDQDPVVSSHLRISGMDNISATAAEQTNSRFSGAVSQAKESSTASTLNWSQGDPSRSIQRPMSSSEQVLYGAASANESSAARSISGVTASETDTSSSMPLFQQLLSSLATAAHPSHQRSLDPRAILSSANCPPHGGTASATVSSSTDHSSTTQLSDPSNHDRNPAARQHLASGLQEEPQFDLTSAALLPLAVNALAAGVTLPLPLVLQAAQQAMQQTQSALSVGNQHPQSASQMSYAASVSATQPASMSATAFPVPNPPPLVPMSQRTNTASESSLTTTTTATPPMYLMDAPAELRANFLNSQRAAGIIAPLLNDPNHFQFGISVNGFHPQNSLGSTRTSSLMGMRAATKNNLKNVKEQKRAQKITDLIENLRMKMENDGWQVGLNKSKFNTLSCCADYIRHLVKIIEEKEAKVKKSQCDLEAARKKADDDKIQSDRSDPESTTSSLTVSSGSANTQGKTNPQETKVPAAVADSMDCKLPASSQATSDSKEGEERHKNKRLRYQESTESGTSSSGSDPGYNVNSKMGNTESVSDLTDSNKGSSSNSGSGSGSGSDEAGSEPVADQVKNEEAYSEDDVSSDAAVARRKAEEQHDSPVKHGKKRKHSVRLEEPQSQHAFEIDFEEVFLNSNIPQLLATTDGRILAWNTFFLRVTGFNEDTIKKATIFGLVRCSKLANLFEIVAKALRNRSQPHGNYLATTLPCVRFCACDQRQLYITVTFMSDADPRKRCFHCVLTDSPPTTESPGPVSEDLLLMLLNERLAPNRQGGSEDDDAPNEINLLDLASKDCSSSEKADDDAADEDDEEGTADEEPDSADEVESVDNERLPTAVAPAPA